MKILLLIALIIYTSLSLIHRSKRYNQIPSPTNKQKYIYLILQGLQIILLIILEGNQVENIYHSLEDNQDKVYQELIDQVNATYGDGGILHFKSMKGIKNYFEHVTIETQVQPSTSTYVPKTN